MSLFHVSARVLSTARASVFAAALVLALVACSSHALAQAPRPFTYQGRLERSGGPFSGTVDLRFLLYDAPTGGIAASPAVLVQGVSVVNGLLTAQVALDTSLAANPNARWLEVAVSDVPGSQVFTTLSPRQELTPAPSASTIAGVPLQRSLHEPYFRMPASLFASNNGWQSFIGDGGILVSIEWSYDRTGAPTNLPEPVFTIYEGRGTGGPVLATTRSERRGGQTGEYFIVPRTGVLLAPGREYTVGFEFAGAVGTLVVSNGAIPPGTDSSEGSPWALRVRSERVRLGVETTGAVDWSSVLNVPPSVSGAFSPWQPFNGTITSQGTVVGVGNFLGSSGPRSPLHVRESLTNAGGGALVESTMLLEKAGDNFLGFLTEVPDASGFVFTRGAASTLLASLAHNTQQAPNGFQFSTPARASAMILTNEATLGVGVSIPQFNIHVGSASDTQIAATGGAGGRTWSIQSSAGSYPVGSQFNGSFQIIDRTINVARVLIDTNGNLGVGVTAPSQRLHVAGNVLANNVAAPSSARFKENVAPLAGGLDAIRALEPVRFDWRPEHAKARGGRVHDIGFVAEEVAAVFPEVVFFDEDGAVAGMDYSRLVAVAISAAKEQDERVRALERENQALRERLERLEKAVGVQ
jgi:hypothetical protein